ADYIGLMTERERLQREVAWALRDLDALLLPTTPLPAVALAEIDQGKSPMSLLTPPVNLLGLCPLALPCGFTPGGLPIPLQIVGSGYEEARILRIGWAFENAPDWHNRRPPVP